MAVVLTLMTIALPWVGALAVWLIGDARSRLQSALAVAFSAAAGLASLALIPYATGGYEFSVFDAGEAFGRFTFAPDGLGVYLAVIATIIGCLAVVFSLDYMKGEHQLGRYYAFVLFFVGAMAGLVLASNLFLVFLFWEITALCSYALISFHNDDPKAVAGGIKALIITGLGGIGLLAGALLAYSYLGTFNISLFLQNAGQMPAGALATVAFGFLAAAAAKSAQFPFQTWLPDAMEAPTPVSALIHAATMVNAGVYLLARFYPAFAAVPAWRITVISIGVITALMAASMAVVSNDLKRVLAYSTVSQLGYMVYAIGAGGIFASQFHLLNHSAFKALLFLGAGAVIHATGTRDLRLMGGLGRAMPVTRAVFIIGSLALVGIPVLNGFWSKELVLEAGFLGGPLWAYLLAILTAGLTALYTYRCLYLVFYGPSHGKIPPHDAGYAMRAALYPLAIAALVTWLLAGPFSRMLAASLPFHEVDLLPTWEMAVEVLSAPQTFLALAVIALGLAAWRWRERLSPVANAFHGLAQAASNSYGFEWLNRQVVTLTQEAGEALRSTQTGQLNWNVVAIAGALVLVLAIVILGSVL
jgi:NADH-quinone oxidoreductase subunit L